MTTTIGTQERGINVLLRILYFLFIGLWLSGVWAAIAWFFCVTIIGLPLGLWMLNRMPQIATLEPQRADLLMDTSGRVFSRDREQFPFLLRGVYFLLIGWWFSALWLAGAWALCGSIIGLPIGFLMFNAVPTVVTLARS
jgi:uncharacterized membrane protein YccF (DUF307 family)